jgi:heptosyltransferase III
MIDLLINDDTHSIGKLIPHINNIYTFSYKKKNDKRWSQEKKIFSIIFNKYDLSINLTASDRSVFYALLAGKKTISAVEKQQKKSWWKRLFLTHHYVFDDTKHILTNNLKPLNILNIPFKDIHYQIKINKDKISKVKEKLNSINVNEFIIFHPSSQYQYKIYPKNLRDVLLKSLSKLGVPVIITGGNNFFDKDIKNNLPVFPNIYDFIGNTSLEEFFALSELSIGYIGMDTLNMHIAASQNKRIFAIFGPTNLKMWSPWSNELGLSATKDKPIQTYNNVTIFQSNMSCVACGNAGCNDSHGHSDCLDDIDPAFVFSEVNNWVNKEKINPSNLISVDTLDKERKIILYIVYGEDQTYYDGAIFSFLSSMNWIKGHNEFEIVILTENPSYFENYPITTILMTNDQKKDWSLNGKYYFRIKNRGLAYVMDVLNLNKFDKILFFDTDTYFHKSLLPLFDLIKPNQAVLYLNEGLIYKRKRFSPYVTNLDNKKIKIGNDIYEISKNSALWGSLMVGIMPNMRPSIEWADKLLVKLHDLVNIHTIEEFALAEALLRNYNLVEGKNHVSLYSTSRKKEYAKGILNSFFMKNKNLPISQQVLLAQKIKIKRPLFVVLKQRFARLLKK